MAMAGGRGVSLLPPPLQAGEGRGGGSGLTAHAWWFGEDQARYLVETADPDAFLAAAQNAGICAQRIGTVGRSALTLPGGGAISVADLKAANEAWLPNYMAQT
jgi:phosphoribosylformylglycinamidine synthase subunit PurL